MNRVEDIIRIEELILSAAGRIQTYHNAWYHWLQWLSSTTTTGETQHLAEARGLLAPSKPNHKTTDDGTSKQTPLSDPPDTAPLPILNGEDTAPVDAGSRYT
ncbi:Hypothetical predicted protein [Pelobates cultripes]|uniref:Uncharacterized protein n=1 Tax=Pelobates cultripes TaxID=61616 RepID=A0AAD1RVL5_PELCU|nr:Hypothetical predicted protein [Pelobates cultripes]